MPGIPGAAAVADGFPLSALRIGEVLADSRSVGVCPVWLPDFGDSRNDLPGHADTVAGLVPRDMVGHHPEERCQRPGAATRIGTEELRDGVGLVA